MSRKLVLDRYPVKQWKVAKSQMRGALVEAVRTPRLLTYKQVRTKITAIPPDDPAFFPGSKAFSRMQGEVSTEEDMAGRGMLTAYMVNSQNHMPGNGFFELASELKHRTADRLFLWSRMLKRVRQAWKNSR